MRPFNIFEYEKLSYIKDKSSQLELNNTVNATNLNEIR
jgi:hypothetical protein